MKTRKEPDTYVTPIIPMHILEPGIWLSLGALVIFGVAMLIVY